MERPVFVPTRDVVLGYHLAPASGEAIDVRVTMKAGGAGLRMDLPDQTYMLLAGDVRRLVLVVPLERMAVELPWADGPQPLFVPDSTLRWQKRNQATVAGQRCTVWEAPTEKARNSVCVSSDGVVLRHMSFDPMGRRSLVEAFAQRFQPVPDEAFAIPGGFERLTAPPK